MRPGYERTDSPCGGVPVSPAAKLLAEAATVQAEVALVEGVTAQQQLRGLTNDFDRAAPLPDLNIRRARASWEPAARHYRDLTDAEKEQQA